jgi:uncharacterized membrane protein HdeD (DUF308 family)
MNKTVLKVIGVAAIVIGSVALYFAGTAETAIGAIVAGVFILAGVIAGIIKGSE